MTDRELLEDVKSKLDALTPRVETLEAAASGAVSHDEVAAVVDAESALEDRVTALESKFQPDNSTVENQDTTPNVESPAVSEPLVLTVDGAPDDVSANHEIS